MPSVNIIRVALQASELAALNKHNQQQVLHDKLSNAGIPVVVLNGKLVVTQGKFMCYNDDLTNERIYLWRDTV